MGLSQVQQRTSSKDIELVTPIILTVAAVMMITAEMMTETGTGMTRMTRMVGTMGTTGGDGDNGDDICTFLS